VTDWRGDRLKSVVDAFNKGDPDAQQLLVKVLCKSGQQHLWRFAEPDIPIHPSLPVTLYACCGFCGETQHRVVDRARFLAWWAQKRSKNA
jgi:hypothetical protein